MFKSSTMGRVHSVLGLAFVMTCGACSSSSSGDDSSSADGGDPGSSTGEPTSSDSTATSETPSRGSDGSGTQLPPDASAPFDGGMSSETMAPVSDGGTTEDTNHGDGGNDGDGGVGDGDGGATPVDPWAGCPTGATPNDAEWPIVVEATAGATYCATFNENRTLKEEQLAKMQLRLAPGLHHLPEAETEPVVLPWCLRDEAGSRGAVTGQVTVTKTPLDETTSYNVVLEQAFSETNPLRLRVALDQSFDETQEVSFKLDGAETSGFDSYQSLELCEVDGEYCFPDVIFTSCAYESGELNTHTVEFEGGEVVFELRLGDSFAGTEPGAFVAARGTFAGATFEQHDYFKLIYHPTHHHFERAFVVLFDEPEGEVCGIEVNALEPFGDDVPDQAFTVDCELNHLSELQVNSHTLLRSSP